MPVVRISDERSDANARYVAEHLLQVTRDAMFAGEDGVRTFLDCFWLPQRIATFTGEAMLETEADVLTVLRQTREHFRLHRITDLIRVVIATSWEGPDRYKMTHMTHVMSGDLRIRDPYPAFSIHERRDGDWRICGSQYAVDDSAGHARALDPRSGVGPVPTRLN